MQVGEAFAFIYCQTNLLFFLRVFLHMLMNVHQDRMDIIGSWREIIYQQKQKTINTALAVKLRRNHGREPMELHWRRVL